MGTNKLGSDQHIGQHLIYTIIKTSIAATKFSVVCIAYHNDPGKLFLSRLKTSNLKS